MHEFGMQIVLVLVCNLLVGSGDDKEEWIDPNDMLNYDPSTKNMRKQTAKNQPPVASADHTIFDALITTIKGSNLCVTEFLGALIQDLQFSVFLSFVVLTVFSIMVLVYFRRSCKDPPPTAGNQPLPTSLGQQKNQITRENVPQDLTAQVDPLRHRKPCRVREQPKTVSVEKLGLSEVDSERREAVCDKFCDVEGKKPSSEEAKESHEEDVGVVSSSDSQVHEADDGFSTRSEEHVGVSVQETTPSSLVLSTSSLQLIPVWNFKPVLTDTNVHHRTT
ncbi:uncharacterized protein [Osmerus mordax]|uniref:uncharacterized protein n=1 Tax=Osmerus mordax TaxID=8014 RepID=UPI00350FD000